ncbi:MAG: sporulation protein YqfD [Zhaonellaceae bacterium]|jgi:similar to stage IV sporulation protein|nr:sporulation protein YqfD [Clostridia bacterium]
MILKRLLDYLLGYCIIKVAGPRKERFINFIINEKIPLWDIVQKGEDELWVKVYVSDIGKLRHIARKSRCSFKIKAKRGFPFLALRAEKRKGLVVGIFLFMIVLFSLSSFIWFVDIHSSEPLVLLSEETILREAARLGLKPGALKSRIHIDNIEQKLTVSLPQLTFVGIEIQGTLVKIEVAEKKVIPEEIKEKPAHLIAAKDGVIEEILVLAGESRVKVGDTVQRGQLLISGLAPQKVVDRKTGEFIEQGPPKVLEAKGIVRARVWYETVSEAPIIERGKRLTGAKREQWSILLGNKKIVLKGPRLSPYADYEEKRQTRTIEWRNLNVPVEVIQTIFYELKPYQRNWGQEGAIKNAKDLALKILETKMPKEARILDQKVDVISQSGNVIKVRVWIETLEDIGEKQYFQPETD